jgi:hypothetical protein
MREHPDETPADDCLSEDAHKYFNLTTIPLSIDGKNPGNYCPYFTDFRAE